ncbi:hypothetical protein G7Z17_g11985 [Cylindrodendrum hubeiense]|uniref:PCI domain-containing protein n=1 Tax=Cylindrodendrum hubeiense TaxID=595255 RepID=A0A9P5LB27_9HYPO|nr:hypothetical protein G7Z17_g11985 [Cylindrodendrum hubeiense]
MEQTKALNALEPFLALSKTASSPRAAVDLVTRATSAPNTFLFAELLDTPAIQSLASSPEYVPHLTLLQIFSHGTYATYRSTPGLPTLVDAQARKLRQLSLLALARDRQNLSYDTLQTALDLPDTRDLEALVISAVYAGLLHATLDPARAAVQTWADRCTSTLEDLETQMKDIRNVAAVRQRDQRAADDKLQQLMADAPDARKYEVAGLTREMIARRGFNKRSVMEVANLVDNESMDVDEPEERANKRKM